MLKPHQAPRAAPAAVELFERRALCDASASALGPAWSPGPTVTSLFVSGSAWTLPFKQHLQANFFHSSAAFGYNLPVGSGAPVQAPWANLNQVSLHMGGEMQVDPADLRVFGVNVREYPVTAVRFDLDPSGFSGTATWTLSRPLVNDKVLLWVDGSENGPRTVFGQGNLVLDGDYDGRPGGDFRYRLNVLPADGDRSGNVSAIDLSAVRTELGTSTSNPGAGAHSYTAFDDLNGDGRLNALDLAGVKQRLNTQLPRSEPAVPSTATLTASSPTSDLFGIQPVLPP
jgi:hypothetical protein